MTVLPFPEWLAQRATWWDRLRCRLIGHRDAFIRGAVEEADDRRLRRERQAFCTRCGKRLPSVALELP